MAAKRRKTKITLAELMAQPPSLVRNINIKRLTKTAKPKSKSTVSKKSWEGLKSGWKKK